MSDIEFSCPACDETLEAPDEMAGETVECPNCEQPMVIPQPVREDASLNDISFGEESAPPLSAADIIAKAGLEAPADDTTECSECGSEMEPGAVLCMGCGYHKILRKKISTELE